MNETLDPSGALFGVKSKFAVGVVSCTCIVVYVEFSDPSESLMVRETWYIPFWVKEWVMEDS